MEKFIVVMITAVGTSLVWSKLITPYLDNRPRKAVFVRPKLKKEKNVDNGASAC